jgi:hypothetical protein
MRRLVILCLVVLTGLGPASAQTGRVHRLAVLGASAHGLDFVRTVTLPELEKLGYRQGQNLVVEMRAGPLRS